MIQLTNVQKQAELSALLDVSFLLTGLTLLTGRQLTIPTAVVRRCSYGNSQEWEYVKTNQPGLKYVPAVDESRKSGLNARDFSITIHYDAGTHEQNEDLKQDVLERLNADGVRILQIKTEQERSKFLRICNAFSVAANTDEKDQVLLHNVAVITKNIFLP